MSLRTSNLDKLWLCPCFEANPVSGPAAHRGTVLDRVFRARVLGQPDPEPDPFYELNDEDLAAIDWAVTTMRTLASGDPILADEKDCRVSIPGLPNPGTADAIVPQGHKHADLKSGQLRSYSAQMAGYAYGLMETHFCDSWTAHLLFLDQRKLVSTTFTYAKAKARVEEIITRFNDPGKTPVANEYCGWCVKRETCPALLAEAQKAIVAANPGFNFATVLSDNTKLGKFLSACSILDDYREQAEEAAKDRLNAGQEIPGWKLSSRRGPEFVDAITVGHHITKIGFGPVLAAYGNLSAKKFRELWAARMPGDQPFPEEAVKHGKATVSLRAYKPTTQTTTNH